MDRPEHFAYAEDHCALDLRLLAMGLYGPVALFVLCLVLGFTAGSNWFVYAAFAPVFCMVNISLLYRNWATGIRVDERGVRIGAVASKGAERRNPTVTHQNWAVFSCPWSGVREMFVVTDPGQVRRLRTSPEYYTLSNRWAKPKTMVWCMAGVLVSPLMRSALVVRIDPAVATVPTFRSALFFSNYTDPSDPHLSRRLQPRVGDTWVVPTRHPERLRALIKDQLHPVVPTPKQKPQQL
ncbi:hypothetical protein [Streptacidiphilus melanogenes]|uniref:hypothetical protein n=1 Tax=Streptacidiphilus melanogenes TaxID=411235 RepID=UPI0005AB1E8B|nr:hypothetical protein [Streptacidiphilus melanogenes]